MNKNGAKQQRTPGQNKGFSISAIFRQNFDKLEMNTP